jgi:hypothetical protein
MEQMTFYFIAFEILKHEDVFAFTICNGIDHVISAISRVIPIHFDILNYILPFFFVRKGDGIESKNN